MRKKAKNTDYSKDRDSSSSSSLSPGIITSDSDLPFLHDDSIEEIVSRLPIKDVLRFGCVSKSAVTLISDRDFIDRHMKSCLSVPMIVVTSVNGSPQFLVDKWWESDLKRSKIEKKKCHLHPEYHLLLSSQDGLIVSTKEGRYKSAKKDYIIFNPIYSQTMEITLTSPDFYYDGSQRAREMLGVFYRPCLNEYSTLWEVRVYCRASAQTSYEVLDLSSQSKWRKIEYPFSQYQRFWHTERVLINGFLYWVCKTNADKYGIMVFDTSIQGFEFIPCPDTVTTTTFNLAESSRRISLLNGNGVLKLVQVSVKKFDCDVNIWALHDRIWSSSQYRIISCLFKSAQIIGLWNEELVLVATEDDQRHKGTFVCNLKLGSTRKFGRRYESVSFTSHVMSLAPIKNLKLKLPILCDESIIN